jgi:AcrR family transcriptional regulator
MPRAFRDDEREHIRSTLLEAGQRLFASRGLRKTSVEELAQAAAISKGAFYLFFTSKEELYFELLERFEADFKQELLTSIVAARGTPQERMYTVLQRALTLWRQHALFTQFSRSEYEALIRRLPAARIQQHLAQDQSFAVAFIAAWKAQGVSISHAPGLVDGMIRALFFLDLHADEFDDGVYNIVQARYIELLATFFTEGSG